MTSAVRTVARRTGIAIAVVIALGVGAVAAFQDALFPRFFEWAVRSSTGARLSVDGPFELVSLAPLGFEARAVTVSFDGGGARIDVLAGEIPLVSFVQGRIHFERLRAHGARVALPTRMAAVRLAADRLPSFGALELEDVRLTLPDAGDVAPLEIARLVGHMGADERLRAQGQGTFGDGSWRLEGQFGTLAELLSPQLPFPVSAKVELPDRGLALEATGRLGAGEGQLDVRATVGDVAWLADLIAPGAPLSGSLEASGRVHGNLEAMGVTGLELRVTDAARLTASVTGDIGDVYKRDGLALDLVAETADHAVLGALGLDALPGIASARARARLSGGPGAYRLEDIDAAASGADGRAWRVGGSVTLEDLRVPASVGELRVGLAVAVPAADLTAWFPSLSDTGRVDLRATAVLTDERLSFEDLELELEGTSPIAGGVSGRGDLSPQWRAALAGEDAREGVFRMLAGAALALVVDVSGDAHGAGELLGLDVPPLGPVSLRTTLTGDARRVELVDLDARLDGPDPMARVQGRLVLAGDAGAPWSLRDVAVDVEASGSDAARLPSLPHTGALGEGPWKSSARLASLDGALAVRKLRFQAGVEGALRIEVTGDVAALGPLGPSLLSRAVGVDVTVRVSAESTARLGNIIHLDLPDLGRAEGEFEAVLEPAGWTLNEFKGQVSDGDRLDLRVSGEVKRVPLDPRFSLELEGRVADPDTLAGKLGIVLSLPASASVQGKLEGTSERVAFDGALGLGATDLTARVDVDASGSRTRAVVALTTPLLDTGDLSWLPGIREWGASGGAGLFGAEPFDLAWLEAADFEASLDAKVLRSAGLEAGPLTLRGVNQDRHLHVALDELSFDSGEVVVELDLDASRSPPALSLEGRGKTGSLRTFHARIDPRAEHVDGSYAFDLDLHATGVSAHELASTVRGHYGHVFADGRLPGGDLDVLALRPLLMVLSYASKDHTRVDCNVIELRAADGVATTESLFLRTEKMLVSGTGRIDLRTETVDVVVHTKPLHKSLLDLFKGRHAARVHGPITDLKLDADVTGAVVGAAVDGGLLGAAALNPPVFAALIGIEYLQEHANGETAQSCHP